MTDAEDRLYWMISGFRTSQLIRTAAMFGICDILASGPKHAAEVAAAVGLDAGMVRRLLRSLVAISILMEGDDGTFSNSELGALLRKEIPESFSAAALALPEDHWYEAWSALPRALKANRVPFEVAHGRTFWDVAADDDGVAQNFNRFMVRQTEAFVPQLLGAYDFSACGLVVDVGGGNGSLVGRVLAKNPSVRGILFDVAAGLLGAEKELGTLGVGDRCELVVGSFFESIPGGADAYMLRQILHDWDDARASEILVVCRRAMRQGANLLVMDRLLPARATDSSEDRFALILDMHMHVLFGSRERTEGELKGLIEANGFAVDRVIAASPQAITVARAV